jgi:hypothetical protein
LPTTAFSVWRTAPVATISMVSAITPTSSLKSTRAVCPAESVTFDSTPLKPESSTLTTYSPIGAPVIRYAPASVVTPV